jgi:hypothetical protein
MACADTLPLKRHSRPFLKQLPDSGLECITKDDSRIREVIAFSRRMKYFFDCVNPKLPANYGQKPSEV